MPTIYASVRGQGVRRSVDAQDPVLAAWSTNCRITAHLINGIPAPLWRTPIPGLPRRTVGSISAHLHNARCRWVTTLGIEHGIAVPAQVDQRTVTRRQLVSALARSARGIAAILQLGQRNGGQVPPSKGYVWRNLALDVEHVLTYFVAHEGHHRGQIVMVARQLGQPLPKDVTDELWQWRTRMPRARSV